MSKTRKQDVLVTTETGHIEERQLETDVLYVASPDDIMAWELDPNQQSRDPKTGDYLQVVSERSKRPLKVFRGRPVLKGQSTDTIASQKEDEELSYILSKSAKNSMLLWLGIVCALIAVIIGIVVLMGIMNKESASVSISTMILAGGLSTLLKRKNGVGFKDINSLDKLKEEETGLVSCFVFVEKNRTHSIELIDRGLIPENSIQRKYKRAPCYLLGLDDEGLWAIEPENEIKLNDTPQDCFLALECEQEMQEAYGLEEPLGQKIKLGILVVLIFCLLVVLSLISVIAMGG